MENDLSSSNAKDLFDCLTACANYIAGRELSFSHQNENFSGIAKKQILLALSGGSDSTALLLSLNKIAPIYGFNLIACHINHNLRGQESDADAEFCQSICAKLNIKCEIIKLQPIDLIKTRYGHTSENTLRLLRYSHLTKYARSRSIPYLVTGHTLDDQMETLLFRIFRGTSLVGLKGMEYCRKLENNLYLLRPLLKLTKTQCQKFVESINIAFQLDSSNLNLAYTRNYIRHKIVPVIEERFPDLSLHLNSLADIAHADNDFIDKCASAVFNQLQKTNPNIWSIDFFAQQPLALQRRILVYALQYRNIEVSHKRIDEIISLIVTKKQYLNLNQIWRIYNSRDKLHWQNIDKLKIESQPLKPLTVNIPGVTKIELLKAQLLVEACLEKIPPKNWQANIDKNSIFADLSSIKPPLILRQRQPGDLIQPLGMSQLVRLKKYLQTRKTARARGSFQQLLVLADQEEVLWVPGIGMSEKIKISDRPSHILKWQEA